MCPKQFSIGFVQADKPLNARQEFADKVFIAWRGAVVKQPGLGGIHARSQTVHHKYPSLGYCRARVPPAQLGFPTQLGTALRKLVNNLILTPDGIPLGAKPLRPVLRLGKRKKAKPGKRSRYGTYLKGP